MKMVRFGTIIMLLFCIANALQAQVLSGSGTAGDPYQIGTPAELNAVRNHLTSYFVQTADIDLTTETASGGAYYNGGLGWEPIGTSSAKFLGSYNGNGFSITGMKINRPSNQFTGLFGYVGDEVVTPSLTNIKIVNATVTGASHTGTLVGACYKTVIQKCSGTGSVTGAGFIGGLVGAAINGVNISQCYANTTVSSTQHQNGGFIGYGDIGVVITNCYALGNVTTSASTSGGFMGQARSGTAMTNCYSKGAVSSSAPVGGFAGVVFASTATNCYWNTETSGQATSPGGTGKTTAEMKTQSTYNSWDFSTIWQINGDYPDLRINSRLPAVSVYLTRDNNDVNASVLYPKVGFGSAISTPFAWSAVSPDWTYNTPKCTVYVVPSGNQGVVASSFVVSFDPTMATVTASAGINNLFSNGLFYTSVTGSGRLRINTSNLSSGINSTPGSGKYLAMLVFTLLKPGHMQVSLDSLDFRQYDTTANAQIALSTNKNGADVKFFLGDFASASAETTGDGVIDINDLSLFATAYWSKYNQASTLYKSKFDVGPTNASGNYFALPTPDGNINFEDLIIFAIGYGKSLGGQLPKASSDAVTVSLGNPVVRDKVRYPIVLSGNVSDVRGLSLTLKTTMRLIGVEKAGALQDENGVIFHNQNADMVQVDAAVIGNQMRGVSESGTIAYLVFENSGSVSLEGVIGRNSRNQNILVNQSGSVKQSMLPETISLNQNYPNPFNPSTVISFALPSAARVSLEVFNSLGQSVKTLVNSELLEAGVHQRTFDARELVSGIYFYKLTTGTYSSTMKMMLVK